MQWASGRSALDYSLEFLHDFGAGEGSGLETLLGGIAVVGGVRALFRMPRWITVMLGFVRLAVALWFLIQVVQMLGDDATTSAFFRTVGLGPVAAIAGGLLMLSGR